MITMKKARTMMTKVYNDGFKTKSKVNILGTWYKIKFSTEQEDVKLISASGYIDKSMKEIVICKYERDDETIGDLAHYVKKVLRHEIIHGYLMESGLDCNSSKAEEWAKNEEMVDFFAIQTPKMYKTFQELGIL